MDNMFETLKQKIKELKSRNVEISAENEQLIAEVLNIRTQLEVCESRMKEIENKYLNLQVNEKIPEGDKKKLITNIDNLIDEIDKGLELLSS